MKKALMIIAIVILVIFFNSLMLGCGIVTGATSPVTSKIENSTAKSSVTTIIENSTVTSSSENSTLTVNAENQAKINDYNNRLKEFGQFITDYNNATQKIDKDIIDLNNKLMEAGKVENWEKVDAYRQVIIDKNEEAINNISKIYVPKIVNDFYSYRLEYYTKKKQLQSYLLSSTTKTWDESRADSFNDEADNAAIKANKELERIPKGFNQEAQELGLTIPFPNM